MASTKSDNAIAAKAHAMYGRRLTGADYDALLKMTSVPEAAAYLKSNTHYGGVLAGVYEQQVHRGQLEASLRNLKFEQYVRLTRYHFSPKDHFYQYLFLWEEIQQIIRLLRFLGTGSEKDYYPQHFWDLSRYCSFDLDAFARARTYGQLLDALAGTPYREIVAKYPLRQDAQKNRIDLVSCERDLTACYYTRMLAVIDEEFSGGARKALREVLLGQIDAERIVDAYRLQRFFHHTPQEIQESLLPFSTPSDRVIRRIAGAATTQEVGQILVEAGLCDHEPGDQGVIENLTLRVRHKACKQGLRYSTHPAVVLVGYITLLEIELENIINIIEAIRYNLSPQDVRSLLIL